ncbi:MULTISPECIES: NfeD family protein [unclassified Leptolyngbya]|uniref:NfeD family protein n=1 Tax=unclassified Leptolyngbya TaxID=2650499 RepID=UPI0016889597|nr:MULTISPECIES: NfeD family protein [unclassified Leptolyngbya]MBD1910745.1 NfeD family protein [Leptolyngbya sp. FACHB-8]MBD2158236.1 NfeD family protein [Leptolyngbya sp. FACHB-16]
MNPLQWLILGQSAQQSSWLYSQPPYQIWLLAGLLGLGVNLLLFEPTIAALSLAAIITSIAALSIVNVTVQILVWATLSVTIALVLRGFVPAQSAPGLEEPSDAEVRITIPRGGTGEVTYEGSFWSARCQISDVTIGAGQTVHVVGREGNTLIVMPIPASKPQRTLRDRAPF